MCSIANLKIKQKKKGKAGKKNRSKLDYVWLGSGGGDACNRADTSRSGWKKTVLLHFFLPHLKR